MTVISDGDAREPDQTGNPRSGQTKLAYLDGADWPGPDWNSRRRWTSLDQTSNCAVSNGHLSIGNGHLPIGNGNSLLFTLYA